MNQLTILFSLHADFSDLVQLVGVRHASQLLGFQWNDCEEVFVESEIEIELTNIPTEVCIPLPILESNAGGFGKRLVRFGARFFNAL